MLTIFEGPRRGLALIEDPELYEVVQRSLMQKGFRPVHDAKPLQRFDFALTDAFFLEHGFLSVLKRKEPDAPVLFVDWEQNVTDRSLKMRSELFDWIIVPRGQNDTAQTRIADWCESPPGRFLFNRPEQLSFGNGLWVWIAKNMTPAVGACQAAL